MYDFIGFEDLGFISSMSEDDIYGDNALEEELG